MGWKPVKNTFWGFLSTWNRFSVILGSFWTVLTFCEVKISNFLASIYEKVHCHAFTLDMGKNVQKRHFKKSQREKKLGPLDPRSKFFRRWDVMPRGLFGRRNNFSSPTFGGPYAQNSPFLGTFWQFHGKGKIWKKWKRVRFSGQKKFATQSDPNATSSPKTKLVWPKKRLGFPRRL